MEGRSKNKSMDGDRSSRRISGTPAPGSPAPALQRKRSHTVLSARNRLPPTKKLNKYEKEVTLHILQPNGTSFKFPADAARIHSVEALLDRVKNKALDLQLELRGSRPVEWGSNVKLLNSLCTEINEKALIKLTTEATMGSTIILLVQDGHPNCSFTDENMWNVTPKREMLGSLPQGYTLETALADQVDNALQAVWRNKERCRCLVSVHLTRDRITIFDTGQGMDASDENCIAKWGTVGSSKHRKEHREGVGGKAPFLKPYFGKYGAGGVASAFHLGKCVKLSSKTTQSNLVATLQLELEQKDDQEGGIWRTPGGFRQPTKEELKLSPHGSFTRVEITKLKQQYCITENEQHYWKVENVRRLLKEIYFPYMQVEIEKEDGSSSETIFPVEFEVNGKNLLGVKDCETAIANTHSCNGKAFVFDIQLTRRVDGRERTAMKQGSMIEGANARVSCQYFPNLKGKEALEAVLEHLNSLQPSRSMTLENMNRVTLRWLGRLLPEVKWPIFPFMDPPVKREQRSLRLWAKRVRAFVDTDAGFHPVMSKTQLETDQPFVVALKNIGSENLDKTSACGVQVAIKCEGVEVRPLQLAVRYQKWLQEMHTKYDEEFIFPFPEKAKYIFKSDDGKCFKDLGLGNSQCIILHTHLKDSKHSELEIKDTNPIFFKLPKGTGLRADKYVALEYFYHDAAEEEGFQVNFLCRGIEVDASEGCQTTTLVNGNYFLELNRSEWFPCTLLNTAQRLDDATWKKKKEELFNKSPGSVEVLNQEETRKFELWEAFPDDMSNLEAGYALPEHFLVVVRPRKGSGKQGIIVPEPMGIKLEVTHCSCLDKKTCHNRRVSVPPRKALGKASLSHTNGDHGRVVWRSKATSTVKMGVKGLYVFSTESSEVNPLVKPGTYTFRFELESEKYKDVAPAVSSIEIVPSKITAKWTLCNHPAGCMIADHETSKDDKKTLVIRLNERVKDDLFLQKYDQYGNKQAFEAPMALELVITTLKGESLAVQSKAEASILASTQERHRLLVEDILFANGSLTELGSAHEALLRAHLAEEQQADIKCAVFAGALADLEVISSEPPIQMEYMSFEDDIRPGEVIKKLTLQGLDECGNKVEKGQKLDVILEGVEFQDNYGFNRVVDENGIIQLGGLLKVTSHYNSTGSITFQSGNGSIVRTINFNTVKRRLVANQVPTEACVGRQLQGISIMMVDEFGNVDTSVNAVHQSITVNWLRGVSYRLINGECLLPNIQMPEKSGTWKGNVAFSGDPSLCVTLTVQLKFGTASTIGSARGDKDVLSAECGVPFSFPFQAYDDYHKPALVSDKLKKGIKCVAKETGYDNDTVCRSLQVECKEVTMSMVDGIPVYEAHCVVSGSPMMYTMTVTDSSLELHGKAESLCKLQHGPVAQILLARSDGIIFRRRKASRPCLEVKRRTENPELTVTLLDATHGQSLAEPLTFLQVKRCSLMPRLTVTLLDSADNLCSSCERRLLRMKVLDCPEWDVKTAEVSRGVAYFESFSLVVPVGSYQVSVELDSFRQDLYSLDKQVAPIIAQFSLKVPHGNYPSALTRLSSASQSVSLTGAAIQYLPPMTVFVESADGMRLQSRPTVGVRLHGDNSISSGPREYIGTFVESVDTEMKPLAMREDDFSPGEAGVRSLVPLRYNFSQVCCPSLAGTYVMEFFVPGTDLSLQSQPLIVRHGPPARLEIIRRQPGQEMDVLQVHLVDRHGNTCEDIYGLEVALELALSKNFAGTPGFRQCDVYGKSAAMVERGKGDFGVFGLRQGMPGMYTLKVFGVESYTNSPASLIPAEAQIFIAQGNIGDTIQQECKKSQSLAQGYSECLKAISLGENFIQQKTAAKRSLEEQMRRIEADLRQKEGLTNNLRRVQEAEHDDEIIRAELAQPLRTERVVYDEIRRRGGNDFALAVLDAQTEGNFLSPQSPDPGARDILGPVVMLGRVESEALNRVLSEVLGPSLLLIICRTQSGLAALEQYDERGKIDESKGLYGFARGRNYRLNGRYDALTLKDITPYERNSRPAVDNNHPQRLLNIDPPVLPSGQVPEGFLGYAVNFVHLKSEHLQIREISRQGQEVGLRETLFFNLLRFWQVYDTRQHMISAKDGLRNFEGGMSLDGGTIMKNMRQRLGKRSDNIPLRFGTVPSEERRVLSLVPPACYAFERSMKMNLISEDMETQHELLGTVNERLSANVQELERCKIVVETTKREQKHITKKVERKQAEISKLMKMKNAIAAKNVIVGTLGNSSGSQDNDSEKMRAFMM